MPIVITALLYIAFSCVIVPAGHGVAPAGLIVTAGAVGWPIPSTLAALSIILVIASDRIRSRYTSVLLGVAGVAAVVAAYLVIRSASERPDITTITGIPFLVLAVVKLSVLVWRALPRVVPPQREP